MVGVLVAKLVKLKVGLEQHWTKVEELLLEHAVELESEALVVVAQDWTMVEELLLEHAVELESETLVVMALN
jgi:hypothetical protein